MDFAGSEQSRMFAVGVIDVKLKLEDILIKPTHCLEIWRELSTILSGSNRSKITGTSFEDIVRRILIKNRFSLILSGSAKMTGFSGITHEIDGYMSYYYPRIKFLLETKYKQSSPRKEDLATFILKVDDIVLKEFIRYHDNSFYGLLFVSKEDPNEEFIRLALQNGVLFFSKSFAPAIGLYKVIEKSPLDQKSRSMFMRLALCSARYRSSDQVICPFISRQCWWFMPSFTYPPKSIAHNCILLSSESDYVDLYLEVWRWFNDENS